ncbi:glucose PTS transporter subunit IIA [Entomospira entomophila]|uniref:PTS system glucose-specific EIIA component n=1 Tax=Entomospira entomophila TaxID=2719988 RepID=A0A968KSP9_9SPIO|nr:glucose PTS transporter subunit IIA [Entomospira entomophilus]NIZ40562.1 PTS glucose transporter subunit IIA [Entomospira entomophilus]WDI36120.1 glucose PTS transporter subunit IIA [Entomospira entomophilus]
MKAVFAPVSGRVIPLERTVDPVFSEKMIGDGNAVDPHMDAKTVYAPVNGKVTVINDKNHAISLKSTDGLDILVHVGVDTVELNGQGFHMLVKVGDQVTAGDPLMNVDFPYVREYATAPTVFVIVTNTRPEMVFLPSIHKDIEPKDTLFTVRG